MYPPNLSWFASTSIYDVTQKWQKKYNKKKKEEKEKWQMGQEGKGDLTMRCEEKILFP